VEVDWGCDTLVRRIAMIGKRRGHERCSIVIVYGAGYFRKGNDIPDTPETPSSK